MPGYDDIKKIMDQRIQHDIVEITSTEILALNGTVKTLVTAPTTAKVLELVSVLLAYDAGDTPYTIGAATNLTIIYGTVGATASTTCAVTGFLDQATDQVRLIPALSASITPVVGNALSLTLAGADVTAGDGVIHASIAYITHVTKL